MLTKIVGVFFLLSIGFILGLDKPSIALLELDASGVSETDVAVLSDRLQSELINTQKYQVMERAKVSDILKEQGFQTSGCTSTDCAVEVGKLIGVEQMVAGNIGKLGQIYTINLRLINVQTGEVLKTAIVDRRCSIEVVLTQCMKEAAIQLSSEHGQQKITLQDEVEAKPKEQPKESQPSRRRQKNWSAEVSLLLGAGWGVGNYTIPANISPDNNEFSVKMENPVNILLAFNLSGNFRANFSYIQSKINDNNAELSYEGSLKNYYPRLLFFPMNWLYVSYGYVFTTLDLETSYSSVGSIPESKTHNESKSALAIGFDLQLLNRIHLIYDYNVIKNNRQSMFTIAFAF